MTATVMTTANAKATRATRRAYAQRAVGVSGRSAGGGREAVAPGCVWLYDAPTGRWLGRPWLAVAGCGNIGPPAAQRYAVRASAAVRGTARVPLDTPRRADRGWAAQPCWRGAPGRAVARRAA